MHDGIGWKAWDLDEPRERDRSVGRWDELEELRLLAVPLATVTNNNALNLMKSNVVFINRESAFDARKLHIIQ